MNNSFHSNENHPFFGYLNSRGMCRCAMMMSLLRWACGEGMEPAEWVTFPIKAKEPQLKWRYNDILRFSRSVAGPAVYQHITSNPIPRSHCKSCHFTLLANPCWLTWLTHFTLNNRLWIDFSVFIHHYWPIFALWENFLMLCCSIRFVILRKENCSLAYWCKI